MEACGTDASHMMKLVFNANQLSTIKPPMLVQEYSNHAGVIFKAFALGDVCQFVKRDSTPDVNLNCKQKEKDEGSPRIIIEKQKKNKKTKNKKKSFLFR